MSAVRCFVAIELDPALVGQVGEVQRGLAVRIDPRAVAWQGPEKWHVTLKFFGNIDEAHIAELSAALDAACTGTHPLALRVGGLGCFPSPRRPRVIWIGMRGEVAELARLQDRIESATEQFAPREARSFHPHITLGRVKTTRPRELREITAAIEAERADDLGGWTAQRIVLVRSVLDPRGSVYSQLAEFPLT